MLSVVSLFEGPGDHDHNATGLDRCFALLPQKHGVTRH
jgi:hypothetical protein